MELYRWIKASEKTPDYIGERHWRSAIDEKPVSIVYAYNAITNNKKETIEWLEPIQESKQIALKKLMKWVETKTIEAVKEHIAGRSKSIERIYELEMWHEQNTIVHEELKQNYLKLFEEDKKKDERIKELEADLNSYKESFEINKEQLMELAAHAKDLELENERLKKQCEEIYFMQEGATRGNRFWENDWSNYKFRNNL